MPSFAGRFAVALLTVVSVVRAACAQGWHEGFETPERSWRVVDGVHYRVVRHERTQGDAHAGRGCEWLRIETERDSRVVLLHDVGRPPVIEELVPSVWIRSDRPGLRLAARIALPRTIDPRTGRAAVAIVVAADGYGAVGRWQQLQLTNIPRLLAEQVRVLRREIPTDIDPREAYLDAVVLQVDGRPGAVNVWIDDLEVAGYVAILRGPAAGGAAAAPPVRETPLGPVVRLPPVQAAPEGQAAPRRVAKLVGSVLQVDDRPMFPRVIQHCGEPLSLLKRLGFNTVWLPRLPAPEVLEEADRLGLWLICPPPRPVPTAAPSARTRSPEGPSPLPPILDIGPQFDCVLAWDLGDDLTAADLEATQQWADQVRAADHRIGRPLICRPRVDLLRYGRVANSVLLLVDRRPLGTSMELSAYAAWVRRQPLAALGTPVWTTVQTQPNQSLREQLASIEPGYAPPLAVSPAQIRLLAYAAVASGSRGLVFASDSPLDATDPDTRQRALTLELLNLELQVLEPWAAAGQCVADAEASVADVRGAVLRIDRARLLLPLWLGPGAQCVPAQSAANALSVKAPGVPEAYNAFELGPHGAVPLRHAYMPGGMCVTLPEFGLTSQVLLTGEPTLSNKVHRGAAQFGRRMAEIERDLAWHRLNVVQTLAGQLAARSRVTQSAGWLDVARKSLQQCDSQLASGNAAGAWLDAQRAGRSLRLVERAYWDAAVLGLPAGPITSPAALSFETLPSHWRLVDRLKAQRGRFSPNRIAGGDCEDVGTMLTAGWRHILNPMPAVQTAVDLAPQAARSGRWGVRLAVAAVDEKKPPATIEAPPLLFTSPAVQVEAGQIVCIHGWVKVPKDISGGADGLRIVDSLSGEALADRIGKTDGWRQFALYRAAPRPGPICVTFALCGLGEAFLDDVAIQVLDKEPMR
jgi:hypothetical protein